MIKDIIQQHCTGKAVGIYSVCSAHPAVIEASLKHAHKENTPLLIEATANQVNQFGGYTDMTPKDFIQFVSNIAEKVGFAKERIIFGGDHLGPTCWTSEVATVAMQKSQELIAAFVAAGFTKIHLDTSMQCADDLTPLTDEDVASRAAKLCQVAEQTAMDTFGHSEIVYVIGTEVPPPGGASEQIDTLTVTPTKDAIETIDIHKKIFFEHQLNSAWQRVIALVVQPGVEFDNFNVVEYQPKEARTLATTIKNYNNMVFEAHSTDYQSQAAYNLLVKDHFAILKVGPQLTFAYREALFALVEIERQIIPSKLQSNLMNVCGSVMQENPAHWQKFYGEQAGSLTLLFSYSDRIRYYWNHPQVKNAVATLFSNLQKTNIPNPLISQYLPKQYLAIKSGTLSLEPIDWVEYNIQQVLASYSKACALHLLNGE
ncbi:D-tagatose-bisphosphate aldolase, class II, non-catalytic subunit [Parashewanella spongiae]|uniref:D-tagatose-bisphosphate aldolase, class II, non-catalytic subunit n=1 Tax=Parashewanella spongiae TaxID=342950 RepID=A0A3A6UL98_9GAMM|nr:D-tagatose-bisphosphate aldolase, class II, non-catalytic subunit [Parashewanella spongiae]MCL1077947.1 D-tagatose-bisphosphate aldolase, class II, non-catalytic subunit [Parashewanella spongiae]RJY18433.1 D-tagatose-bisphosphate aldolase, class II, non-catalytic subunit [Parashewanella spongiae]